MRTNIFAYTTPRGSYPGYVSINRLDNGDVEVTVRERPKQRSGVYVCATRKDYGPGRCVPGSPECNNYCALAPEKGPMADSPRPCEYTEEGKCASFVVPADEWGKINP